MKKKLINLLGMAGAGIMLGSLFAAGFGAPTWPFFVGLGATIVALLTQTLL